MTFDAYEELLAHHLFQWREDGWVGRSDRTGDFHDLYVERTDEFAEHPPVEIVERLLGMRARAAALKAAAVDAIVAARIAKLNWKVGPPVDRWSLIEMRIDKAGALWVTAHEHETDEYSAWPVRFDSAEQPELVLRRVYGGETSPWANASVVWERSA